MTLAVEQLRKKLEDRSATATVEDHLLWKQVVS